MDGAAVIQRKPKTGAAKSRAVGETGRVVRKSLLTNHNFTDFGYSDMAEAFPEIDPGHVPLGSKVLVQIRLPKRKSAGGIILQGDTRSTEYYNTQVAKVIAIGPLAFKSMVHGTTVDDESVLKAWPEGVWYNVGDFVRVPKYGGDRIAVPYAYEDTEKDPETGREEIVKIEDEVICAFFKATDVLARITASPLKYKAFLD